MTMTKREERRLFKLRSKHCVMLIIANNHNGDGYHVTCMITPKLPRYVLRSEVRSIIFGLRLEYFIS